MVIRSKRLATYLLTLMMFIIIFICLNISGETIESIKQLEIESLSKMDLKVEGDKISINVINVRLDDLLNAISKELKVKILFDTDIYGRVTLNTTAATNELEKLLNMVINNTAVEGKLSLVKENNIYRISKFEDSTNYKTILKPEINEEIARSIEKDRKKGYSEEDIDYVKYKLQCFYKGGIENGYVIAYGHYIEPPYEITLKEKKIFINGIQYFPTIEFSKGTVIKREKFYPFYKKEESLQHLIYLNYQDWFLNYGKEEALERLTDFLNVQPMIKDFRTDGDMLDLEFIRVNDNELVFLYQIHLGKRISEDDESKEIRRKMNDTIEFLNNNGLLLFGRGYSYKESKEINLSIREVMNLNVDNIQKEALLNYIFKNTSIKKTALKSILVNYNSMEYQN